MYIYCNIPKLVIEVGINYRGNMVRWDWGPHLGSVTSQVFTRAYHYNVYIILYSRTAGVPDSDAWTKTVVGCRRRFVDSKSPRRTDISLWSQRVARDGWWPEGIRECDECDGNLFQSNIPETKSRHTFS